MTTTIPALAVSSLSAGYGRFDVVRDVSLQVAPGEAVALLGPNGAGKTTVLRAIMGLVRHRRGSIRVNGAELTGLATHEIARGRAALVPFDSGFSLRLMLKDMRIALGLAESAGTQARLSVAAAGLWAEAAEALPGDADHTEIARWLDSE